MDCARLMKTMLNMVKRKRLLIVERTIVHR